MTQTSDAAPKKQSRRRPTSLRIWNRRIHNYVGLYFLLFIGLFAVSGLLLNHSDWTFAEFWPQREEQSRAQVVRRPAATGDLAIARDLMRQLQIVGEVNETGRSRETGAFEFQVARPGQSFKVEADLQAGRAKVTETRLNGWGVFHTLHTFSGVKIGEPERQRDWLLTKVWSFAIDALAIGLIVLVATGVYLWLRLRRKRWAGILAVGAGTACCALFVVGLGLLFKV